MHSVIRTPPGRPSRLARWWLVALVLAGTALAHGLQCRDGMTTTAMAMPAAAVHAAEWATADRDTESAHIDDGAGGLAGLGGGLLGACLALLVGVLAALLLDHHRVRRTLIAVLEAPGRSRRLPARVRAPTLAQLCLRRT